jgi:bile acid:Na+ symporter, BASS family
MPIEGPIPGWLLSGAAIATVFTVMFDLGLAIVPGDFRRAWKHPGLMLKGLFSVLVVVPAVALLVTRMFELARPVEIGIVLMAISPGAPVALRRSLNAGGDRAFAPALQIAVAILAVVSMPLWIAALDEVYGASASIDPRHLARQVFIAQLLPLGLGMLIRQISPHWAGRITARLDRVATILLLALALLALIDVWQTVVNAGLHATLAIVLTTALVLACGHALGGPDPASRTALAIVSAARNPGLALLVAAVNGAAPGIIATVLAYLVVSALTVIPYLIWRHRIGATARQH